MRRNSPKRDLIEERLRQPLHAFIDGRYRPYHHGYGWRVIAAEIAQLTGVTVSHETLRDWFADEKTDPWSNEAA